MDETQTYLNSILKKRLGSVVNYGGTSKTANNVTRIPKQQQKVESMPTVFRKKHQTVYVQNHNQGSHYSQAQSQYLSMKQGSRIPQSNQIQQMPQQNKQSSNQRVEYMLISKRIQLRKQDQFISPTVDVTNYAKNRKSEEINLNKKNKQYEYKTNVYTGSAKQINHSQSQEYLSHKNNKTYEENQPNVYDYAMGSKMSNDTDKSKRKKIFGR